MFSRLQSIVARRAMGVEAKARRALWRVKERRGEPVRFDVTWGTPIRLLPEGQIPELLYVNRFEETELRLCSALLGPGMRVLDVGANVGLYSLLASSRVGPSGCVWAFEPSSETAGRLQRNLSLNGVDNVTVHQVALGEEADERVALRRDDGFRDGDRYVLPEATTLSTHGGDTEVVDATTVDTWWGRRPGSERERLDFWKMDIEGGEFAAFRGAREVLEGQEGLVLLFECTKEGCERSGHRQADVFRFLERFGFTLTAPDLSSRCWRRDESYLCQVGNTWACRYPERLERLTPWS